MDFMIKCVVVFSFLTCPTQCNLTFQGVAAENVVRFTLDGVAPTATSGTVWTAPGVLINALVAKTRVVVLAQAYAAGAAISPVIARVINFI